MSDPPPAPRPRPQNPRVAILSDAAKLYGMRVRTILYIGANRGQELGVLRRTFAHAAIHCFEPLSAPLAELSERCAADRDCHVHRVALGAENGRQRMYRSDTWDMSSSLRRPSATMAEVFPQVTDWHEDEVEVVRLDDWARDRDLEDDLLIKMDVQGAEDLVLAGGEETFARARAVIAELAVRTTYEDAPPMQAMFDRLLSRGFGYAGQLSLVRATETHEVIEFDGVFVRPRPRRGAGSSTAERRAERPD